MLTTDFRFRLSGTVPASYPVLAIRRDLTAPGLHPSPNQWVQPTRGASETARWAIRQPGMGTRHFVSALVELLCYKHGYLSTLHERVLFLVLYRRTVHKITTLCRDDD